MPIHHYEGWAGKYERELVMQSSGMTTRVLLAACFLLTNFSADYGILAGVHVWVVAYAAPSVVSTLPASSSTGIPLNRWVKASFSEAMNASTITASSFTLQKIAPGTITVNITQFAPLTTYTRSLSYTSSPFAGIYEGSFIDNTNQYGGSFVTGISGDGNMRGIAGAATAWEYFSTTLQGSSSPWGFNASTNMLSHFWGTVSYESTSGNWSNTWYAGTFSGNKMLGANTVYSASDTNSAILAEVFGDTITCALVDILKTDYWYGSGNIDAMGNFAIPAINSYRYGSNVASATGTINRSFTKVSGAVSYDPATRSALFKPNVNLLQNTSYRATINRTVANPDGVQMAADYAWEFATGTTMLSNLSLTVTGSGSGSVDSNAPAPGFTCSSGACEAQFSQSSSLTLTAVPGSGSIFSGWTGDCPAEGGISCTVSMNTDRNITAGFIITPPVHIVDGDYYNSLQDAFNAVNLPLCTIRAQEGWLTGSLNANANSDITLAGGFDSDYTDNYNGFTNLDGTLTIVHGSLTIENLVIE